MSSESTDGRDKKTTSLLLWIVGGLLAFALVSAAIILFRPARNELALRGVVSIQPGRDVDVYVGNKHLGTGPIDVSWDDILGTPNREPLAIPIDPASSPPDIESGGLNVERLTDDDSEIVWTNDGETGTTSIVEPLRFAIKEVLLRRPDGSLDHVFVLDGAFTKQQGGKWRRFVVPIRLRSHQQGYFATSGSTEVRPVDVVQITNVDNKLQFSFEFRNGSPPTEFSEEIDSNQMWTPTPD